ncbi:UNVERIFIED_CONTAM: hypothetical protein Sradi_6948600 [Sesamum radiatum]|uniref:Uncharacterized protein n=1 Tax=Sesamum radiatum TaxID=300843 RepID=A0AAW2JF56_SESRA
MDRGASSFCCCRGERCLLVIYPIPLERKSYDCRAMIDEKLLGHFCLSPQVEPFYEWGERWVTPLTCSPKGIPASNGSKGKRPMSPHAGVTFEGPSKRTRASSLGTPPTSSSKPSATHLPLLSRRKRGSLLGLPALLQGVCLSIPPLLRTRERIPLGLML